MTIDKIKCKIAFNKVSEQEQKEIKAEARAIADAKKQRERNKKLVWRLLGKVFKKK